MLETLFFDFAKFWRLLVSIIPYWSMHMYHLSTSNALSFFGGGQWGKFLALLRYNCQVRLYIFKMYNVIF